MTLTVTAGARAQLAPLGDEVALDPQADVDLCPALGAHDGGGFGVGWTRIHGGGSAVLLRTADGAASLGALRTLDSINNSVDAAIEGLAATANGYEAMWQKPTAPTRYPHFVQQLDDGGSPHGPPAVLARHNVQMSPRPVGGIVAVWTVNKSLNVQRLAADGTALGPPVKLKTSALGAAVLHRPSGEFVVLWRVAVRGNGDGGYLAQRFSAQGQAVGRPIRVAPPIARGFTYAIGALGADGTLAVVSSVSLDYNRIEQVTLRIFDAAGHAVGGPVPITTHADATIAEARPQAVALDGSGRALVIWAWSESLYEPHARARLYARDGAPIGDFFDPASDASRDDFPLFYCGAAAWDGSNWVVTWSGFTSPLDENSNSQIWVRRFAGS